MSTVSYVETDNRCSCKFSGMDAAETIRIARERQDLSQKQVADRVGMTQQSYEAIEAGRTQRSKFLPRIAKVLGLDLAELDPALKEPETAAVIPAAELISSTRDFRVYASAEGGPGEIIRSAEPVDWVPRPAIVQHASLAYGLIITGDSMVPEFEPGDTAIVNPQFPTHGGTTCIFYTEREGEARATIKRLTRTSSDKWFLRQWNPPHGMKHDFTLSRKEWAVCHRVLGKYYRQ